MTTEEIGKFYTQLPNGDKGRFTAYASVKLGYAPHTWQQKFLAWAHGYIYRPVSPVIERELTTIIQFKRWKNAV